MPTRSRAVATVWASTRLHVALLALLWAAGTAIMAIAAWKGRYFLTNIDAVSYVSIAEQYARGHIGDALNAYWSPFLSWAMAPLVAAGVDSIAALMIVNAIAGSLGAAVGTWWVFRRTAHNLFAAAVFLGVSLSIGAGAVFISTPDLLVVTWTTIFVVVLAEVDSRVDVAGRRSRILWAALLGVTCAVGYFVKLYLVPVFVVVLVAWAAVRLLRSRRANGRGPLRASLPALAAPAVALVALVIVAAPWVGALSVKYGEVMIGSSFVVNVAEKFDPSGPSSAGSLTLESPPNPYAIAWIEDPTVGVPESERAPSSSAAPSPGLAERLRFYVAERLGAFPLYLKTIQVVAPFAVPILALVLVGVVLGVSRREWFRPAGIAAGVATVYLLGYAAIVSTAGGGGNHRYYWPLLTLTTLALVLCWPAAWTRVRSLGSRWRAVVAVALVCLVPAGSMFQLVLNQPLPFANTPSSLGIGFIAGTPTPPAERVLAERIVADGVIAPHDNVASNRYRKARLLAFYMRAQAFGRDRPNDLFDPAFQAVLREKRIDYYLLFTPTPAADLALDGIGSVAATYPLGSTCAVDGDSTSEGPCLLQVIRISG